MMPTFLKIAAFIGVWIIAVGGLGLSWFQTSVVTTATIIACSIGNRGTTP